MDTFKYIIIPLLGAVILFYALAFAAKKFMPADGNQNRSVTGVGFVIISIFTASLFIAYSLEFIAPQIPTQYRFIITASIIISGLGIEHLLKKKGIKLTSGNKNDSV